MRSLSITLFYQGLSMSTRAEICRLINRKWCLFSRQQISEILLFTYGSNATWHYMRGVILNGGGGGLGKVLDVCIPSMNNEYYRTGTE